MAIRVPVGHLSLYRHAILSPVSSARSPKGETTLKICLLTDAYADSTSPFKEHDLPCDPRPYLPGADWHSVALQKSTAVGSVVELAGQGFDLFFNLCDGAWAEDRPGIEVVLALERVGAAFTGATSEFYEPTREAMKRVCDAWGVSTPRYAVVAVPDDVERAAAELAFPLIVKHPSSYSSIGMTRDSRVETPDALRREAQRMTATFGAALVEEFVLGRQFTVLVAENPDDPLSPTTYTPVEFLFPEGESFKHFDLKWIDYAEVRAAPLEDGELGSRLRELSAKVFRGLNGAGFGRVDIRVRPDGMPFFLEINPNCDVYYPETDPGSADICLFHDPAGHEGFTRQIVAAALRRRDLRQRSWEVRPVRDGGYGMFATRSIARGERIVEFEQQPQVLVSRSHVERELARPGRRLVPALHLAADGRESTSSGSAIRRIGSRSTTPASRTHSSRASISSLATRSLSGRRSPSTTRRSATS